MEYELSFSSLPGRSRALVKLRLPRMNTCAFPKLVLAARGHSRHRVTELSFDQLAVRSFSRFTRQLIFIAESEHVAEFMSGRVVLNIHVRQDHNP